MTILTKHYIFTRTWSITWCKDRYCCHRNTSPHYHKAGFVLKESEWWKISEPLSQKCCTNSARDNVEQGSLRYKFHMHFNIFWWPPHHACFSCKNSETDKACAISISITLQYSSCFYFEDAKLIPNSQNSSRLYRRRICKISALIRFRLMCLARSQLSLTNGWPIMRAETDNCKTNRPKMRKILP